jgi:uncharacterized protein DUF6985
MPDEPFGPLTYSKKAGVWSGRRALPRFAAVAARSTEKPPLDDAALQQLLGEARQGLDRKMDELRQKMGPGVDKLFQAMQEERTKPPPRPAPETPGERRKREAEEERERAARAAAEERRRQGLFPFTVVDPTGAGPTPEQEAAFRHLVEHEAEVCQAVLEALYRSYQQYSADERWRRICGLPEIASPAGITAAAHLSDVRICRESAEGVAHLLFEVDCDWEQEHGLCVVYRKDTGADWTTFDSVDELLGVEHDEEDFEPSGYQELFQAVRADDQKKVQQLLAAGHDINAVGQFAPPLCMAVQLMDVGLVRRLLAVGADPKLKDFQNKTPLQHARDMLKTFAPPKGDKVMEAMLALAGQRLGPVMGDFKGKLEEIIRLLEGAGAK